MTRRVIVSVVEGERFVLPPHLERPGIRERLIRRAEAARVDAISLDRRGLRAGNVVGLIDFGAFQLQILPKSSETAPASENETFLLNLLAESGIVRRSGVMRGRIKYAGGGVLEPLINAIATTIFHRLRAGLPRRYSFRQEWLPVVRGRIEFSHLAQRSPSREHLLPVAYAPLQRETPLAVIVRLVVERLLAVSRSARNRAILRACLDLLPLRVGRSAEVSLNGLTLTPIESEWADVLQLARALFRGDAPVPVSPGASPLFTLLFPLQHVFERLVRRCLGTALAATDVQLANGSPVRYLLRSPTTGRELLSQRPDFLFHQNASEYVLVGDAKWKKLALNSPTWGVTPGDLYQLTTYMTTYDVPSGILFFPEPQEFRNGPAVRTYIVGPNRGTLIVAAIDVPSLVSMDAPTREQTLQFIADTVRASVLRIGISTSASAQLPRGAAEPTTHSHT